MTDNEDCAAAVEQSLIAMQSKGLSCVINENRDSE